MNRAQQIRQDFDASFRLAPAPPSQASSKRLLLSLEERQLTVAVQQVREVLRGRTITALPGAPREQLGLIGWRGTLLPVFRLTDLMGWSAPATAGPLHSRVGDA